MSVAANGTKTVHGILTFCSRPMPVYYVHITDEARENIRSTYRYIAYELLEPQTAERYVRGIYDTIQKLSYLGYSLAVSDNKCLVSLYGNSVRTIRYKRMTVVYNMVANTVYVRRVMASGLVR
jgi:plasmid stabilization system protein ParE